MDTASERASEARTPPGARQLGILPRRARAGNPVAARAVPARGDRATAVVSRTAKEAVAIGGPVGAALLAAANLGDFGERDRAYLVRVSGLSGPDLSQALRRLHAIGFLRRTHDATTLTTSGRAEVARLSVGAAPFGAPPAQTFSGAVPTSAATHRVDLCERGRLMLAVACELGSFTTPELAAGLRRLGDGSTKHARTLVNLQLNGFVVVRRAAGERTYNVTVAGIRHFDGLELSPDERDAITAALHGETGRWANRFAR